MPEQSNDYRVVVFGAGGVGKSSLVLRFVRGTFRDTYVPTIEDTYRQVISCNKQVRISLSAKRCVILLLCVKLSLRQKRQRDTSVCLFVLYVCQGRPSYGGGTKRYAFSKFKGIKIRDQPIHEILSVDYHENH